ncbi:hypothetical protein RhiirB3_473277 [Rhizophagus irregularis]|nr:hypothetical protein RhiirB3_473277 [Rhizophagus irregularis]
MSSELEVLITELEAKKTDEKATRLEALRQSFAELEARILKLEQDQAERENKKNHKFQVTKQSKQAGKLEELWQQKIISDFVTSSDNPNIVINGNYTPDVSDFTKFITSEFMIYGKQANLITHPCQFGKSTNLSMLYTFLAPTFTEEEKTQRLSLFKDLRISKFKWFIKSNFGNWPVIHISFKDLNTT